jgi:putative sigma-54 modulation protein
LIDGQPLRGKAAASTFKAATDDVIDKLERRTVEHKQRPRDRARSARARYYESPELVEEDIDQAQSSGPLVVKVKRFGIKPMFWEDAVSRMEELGHDFFIFVNAENERVAVLYQRKDGRYGLIEPVIAGSYTGEGEGQ